MMASALFRIGRLVMQSQYCIVRALSNSPMLDVQELQHSFAKRKKIGFSVQTVYNETLQNARTLDQLLSSAEQTHLNGKQIIFILNNLRKWTANGQIKTEDFVNDSRFLNVCQILLDECKAFTHTSLLSALHSILQVGLSPKMMIVEFLENEVLWKAKKMNLKSLIHCLCFHKYYQETKLQKTVVEELIKNIEERQYEINDGLDVLRLFQEANLFSDEFLVKVESEALVCISNMSADQLYRLLLILSQINRRPITLLQRISNYMNEKTEKHTVKQLINILYALNLLSFPDSVLIQNVCSGLIIEIPKITKPQLISSLLISLGKLSWRNESLLEACSDWIVKNVNICRPQEFAAYVLTLARVNYHPEDRTNIFHLISPHLVENKFDAKKVWLDVVWSLAILNQATSDHLSSVLKPSFYTSLIENDDNQSNIIKLKLLNLKAIATIEHPMNPAFSNICDAVLKAEIQRSNKAKQLTKSVIDALRDIVPIGKFMVIDQNSHMGFSINAEFIVDKKGKPLPIEKYGVRSGLSNICNPLPPDIYRIALLVWQYKDFTVNSPVLTGVNALAVQLLKKLGYITVEIPYTEYSDTLTPVKKIQYLQLKITESIENNVVPV